MISPSSPPALSMTAARSHPPSPALFLWLNPLWTQVPLDVPPGDLAQVLWHGPSLKGSLPWDEASTMLVPALLQPTIGGLNPTPSP